MNEAPSMAESVLSPQLDVRPRDRRSWILLCAFLAVIALALTVYSETIAFVWDEGFHLVAAQLIAAGKTPYIDFAFPQTLLNAYLNAFVIRLFGDNWHAIHAFDVCYVIAAMCLTADYLMRRFPERRWRLACAIAAASLYALHTVVIGFSPIAQAYALGTLLCVAAFRVACITIHRASVWPAFLAALLSGAAAGSTLLCAPVILVLLIWIISQNQAGSRPAKLLAFVVGAFLPFTPEFLLLLRAPRQTFFNVVQYQALFRRVNWGDAGAHDFDVFMDWTVSGCTLLLGLLAAIGVVYLVKTRNWDRDVKREFYLAAWNAFALALYIATAHPTFGRYFVFAIPFMAILAAVGFYYVGSRLVGADRPRWPLGILLFVLVTGATKYVFDDRDSTTWHDLEKISAKVAEVTPRNGEILADEMVYFILHRTPPSGMEFSYSHKLQLPPAQEALYHIVSEGELKKQIAGGRFDTVESCKDEVMDEWNLNEIFPHKQDFDDCTVFWRKGPPSPPQAKPKH